MARKTVDVDKMEQVCVCECGEYFDLSEGVSCVMCGDLYCDDCLESSSDICAKCMELY